MTTAPKAFTRPYLLSRLTASGLCSVAEARAILAPLAANACTYLDWGLFGPTDPYDVPTQVTLPAAGTRLPERACKRCKNVGHVRMAAEGARVFCKLCGSEEDL